MLCERCQKRDATMHLTKIINKQKKEMNLCEVCASQEGLDINSFKWDNFIADFFNNLNVDYNYRTRQQEQTRCDKCGLTNDELFHYGKLGCSSCYEHYSYWIEPLLRKIHGNNKHTGKIPLRSGEKIKGNMEIKNLKVLMEEAVKEEKFEKAAELRDKIKNMEASKERGEL